MIPLPVEYEIETVQWIFYSREASRTLYFRYYVNKLNRCCLHAVFSSGAINETRVGSLNPQTEGNQGEKVLYWRGMYNLFVVAYLHGDGIFIKLFAARNLRNF